MSDISASAHIFTTGGGGTFGSAYDSFDPTVLSTSGTIAGLVQPAGHVRDRSDDDHERSHGPPAQGVDHHRAVAHAPVP
ncbi:MAG: hypothetical protein ACXWH7_08780 [Thermoanaerobaculia bacterium]